MQWLFWVIYQIIGLGIAFSAHFLHDFSMQMFLFDTPNWGQSFNVIPFFLLKISKCVIDFLFRQLMS